MNRRENQQTQLAPRKGRNFVRVIAVSLALAAATAAVYWNVGHFEPVGLDDPGYVFENPHVLGGLSRQSVEWAFTATRQSNWHPLTWLSHMADCQLFGPRSAEEVRAAAGWHHITSLLLHIASTVLLFFVLRRMTRAFWASAAVAALFALHPLHVESVAWIAERKDVLSTLLAVLGLGAYALYAERPGVLRYAAVFVLLAFGLMAKPMLVTLPLVMLLLDYWPLGRLKFKVQGSKFKVQGSKSKVQSGKFKDDGGPPALGSTSSSSALNLVLEKIPLLALAAASAAVTYYVQHSTGSMGFGEEIPFAARAENAAAAYVGYLGKAFWPTHLAVFYPYPKAVPLWPAYAAVMAAVTVLVTRAARARPYLAVGWLWYVGTLVPVIGLVQVGSQAMADRYTYMPLIGIFIIVVWGAADLLASVPWRRYALALLGGGAVAACAVLAYGQVQCWANTVELFAHAAAVTKDNALAYFMLGREMMTMKKPDAAAAWFREAIAAHPEKFPFAHNSLGLAYVELGKSDPSNYKDATKEFELAIASDPNFPEAHNNLGMRYEAAGEFDKAVAEFRRCIELNRDLPQPHYQLGRELARRGNLDEAAHELTAVVRMAPNDPDANNELGVVLWRQGHARQAADLFRRALAIQHDKLQPLRCLAMILATDPDDALRDGAEAVRLAERACAITNRRDPAALDSLAAAYAEAGRMAEAVMTAQQAVDLAASGGDNKLADAVRARLNLYKTGVPYRGLPGGRERRSDE